MIFFKKKYKTWQFTTRAKGLEKLASIKHPETYELVQNRVNGKIVKGWVLRTRK